MDVFEAQLSQVRSLLDRLERGSLPSSLKSAGRLVRRLGRLFIVFVRSGRSALHPKMIKRNVVYPIRNLVLRDKPLEFQIGGQPFVLAPRGAVPLEMWSGRWSEESELELVLSVLRPGMTFVDVGANVGFFSIPAAKKIEGGTVLAFEPHWWTYERLVDNVRLNGVTNLLAFRSALADYEGEAVLHVNATGKDGLNTIGRPSHPDSEVVGTEVVSVVALDDFLCRRSISLVDVMKVDVEGAELFVFRGARQLLSGPVAPLIVYESSFLSKGFDYHPVEPMWLLEKYGYSLFLIDSNGGKVSTIRNPRSYNSTVIAVKPTHPQYGVIEGRAR